MTTLAELIERTSKEFPAAFKDVTASKAAVLLRRVFATSARDIDQSPDGRYPVAGLGTFRVRTVPAGADGTGGGRRVMFQAAPPKARTAT